MTQALVIAVHQMMTMLVTTMIDSHDTNVKPCVRRLSKRQPANIEKYNMDKSCVINTIKTQSEKIKANL